MENGATNVKSETEEDVDVEKKVKAEAEEKPAESEDKSISDEQKTEETKTEPTPELLQRVKSQIEFYFGNVNLHRDKFLIEQTKLDEGWVPLTVMFNFKMLARMSTDPEVVIKALESSDLMEISEDKKKIRRSPQHPLPVYNEEYRKAQEARTVYMKGFPLTDITIEKLKTFLAPYEPVENIIMRKYKGNDKMHHFKGSIFVQFKTLEDAKAFMAREPIKYNDTELIRKWVSDYQADKAKEKEEMRSKKKSGKKSQDVKATEESENEEPGRTIDLPKGSAIFMSDVPDVISIENIKEGLQSLDLLVAYIDYSKGDKQGWIRLQGENAAASAMAKLTDGKLKVRGYKPAEKPVEKEKPTDNEEADKKEEEKEAPPAKKKCIDQKAEYEIQCRLPEGDEEEKYLEKAKAQIANIRNNFRNKRKKASRGGRQNSKFRNNEDKSRKRKFEESKEGNAKKVKSNEGS